MRYVNRFGLVSAWMVATSAGATWACTQPTPPPNPPPMVLTTLSSPTRVNLWIQLEAIFETTTPHLCSCGLGTSPLPPAASVAPSFTVGTINFMTGEVGPTVAQFGTMTPGSDASAGWAAGPPGPFDPNRGAPAPGLNWAGFGGLVAPVATPTLLPGFKFAICFSFDIVEGLGPTSLVGQFGGGLGVQNGGPDFEHSLPHGASYSNQFTFTVPTPSGAAAFGLIAVCGGLRRRR